MRFFREVSVWVLSLFLMLQAGKMSLLSPKDLIAIGHLFYQRIRRCWISRQFFKRVLFQQFLIYARPTFPKIHLCRCRMAHERGSSSFPHPIDRPGSLQLVPEGRLFLIDLNPLPLSLFDDANPLMDLFSFFRKRFGVFFTVAC